MPEERGEIDPVSWSVRRKNDLQRSTSGGNNLWGSNIERSTMHIKSKCVKRKKSA